MADPRYCENCRFFAPAKQGKEYGRCTAQGAVPTDISRFVAPEFNVAPYASVTRFSGGCGTTAKWFEPKQ